MKLAVLSCVVASVAFGGCSKKSPNPGEHRERSEPTGSATSPVAHAPAPSANDLPLSGDVLPSGEATPNTRVVSGPGYRFQIPQDATREDRGGLPAYIAMVEGFGSRAPITFWVTTEPFKGELDALVDRETRAVIAEKASEPDVGPVMVQVTDNIKQGYAKRMTVKFPDRIELRTLVVHEGTAYVLHCATPNVANAWANVGSDCITRSTTLHVAPGAPTGPSQNAAKASAEAAIGGPPPQTTGVTFFASKLEGTARKKPDINPWLETGAQYLKPCVAAAPSGSTWKITFELDKEGKGRHVSTEGGADEMKPADEATTACLDKAAAQLAIGTKASDSVNVTVVFVRN